MGISKAVEILNFARGVLLTAESYTPISESRYFRLGFTFAKEFRLLGSFIYKTHAYTVIYSNDILINWFFLYIMIT